MILSTGLIICRTTYVASKSLLQNHFKLPFLKEKVACTYHFTDDEHILILLYNCLLRRTFGGRKLWESRDERKWGHDKFEELTVEERHYDEVNAFSYVFLCFCSSVILVFCMICFANQYYLSKSLG